MDFYNVLQSILDEKSLSIPEAARLSGLSDSTIRTILSRKNKSVSLEVAFKLSAGLGVSMERLNCGEKIMVAVPSTSPQFSKDEIDLIFAYRRANSDDRTIVDAALHKYMSVECIKRDA